MSATSSALVCISPTEDIRDNKAKVQYIQITDNNPKPGSALRESSKPLVS